MTENPNLQIATEATENKITDAKETGITDVNETMALKIEKHTHEEEAPNIIPPLRKSTWQHKSNIQYTDYLHTEIEEDGDIDMSIHETMASEEIGARMWEFRLTQDSLGRRLKLYGEQV